MSSDPAFELLIACAAWPPTPEGDAHILHAAEGIDWAAFVAVIDRHRMAGIAWAAVQRVPLSPPAEYRAALSDRARRDTIQALELSLLAGQLCDRLRAAGIACGVVKGPPLALATYGTLAVRQVRDLDLWVDPTRFDEALTMLLAEEFAATDPHGTMCGTPMAWFQKEVVLKDAQERVVELHSRVWENAALFTGAPRFVSAPCGAGQVPALAGDELLLYLCVHGQGHVWERLKWLADVATLLARQSPCERALSIRRADAAGLRIPLDLALHLCAAAWPGRIAGPVPHGWRITLLARLSRDAMRRPLDPATPRGMRGFAVASLLMTTCPHYWWMLLLRWSIDNHTARRLGGGYAAQALSIAARVPLLLWRRLPALLRSRGTVRG